MLIGCLITINQKYEITACNAAAEKLLGLPSSSLIGINIHSAWSKAFGCEEVPLIARCLQEKKEVSLVEAEVGTGEKRRILSTSVTLLYNHHHEPCGALALIHDLTDVRRKEKEQFPIPPQAALSEVAAEFAHEIRNPLTTIRGLSQLLRERALTNVETQEILNMIIEEVDRANFFIQSFLEVTQPQNLTGKFLNNHLPPPKKLLPASDPGVNRSGA